MSFISAGNIREASDLKYLEEQVPEWGGVIRLREMAADEALRFTELMAAGDAAKDGMYLIIVACACDVDGNLLFTAEDIPMLKTKNLRVLNRVQRAALKVNSMIADEVDLKKDLGEAAIAASPIV